MKKILVLAAALLLTSVAYTESPVETSVKEKSSIEQNIERSKSMLKYYEEMKQYYEEMKQYNIDYYKWQVECRKLDEKYYKACIKFQKANAKRLAKIKKVNEARAAIDNASTKEERFAATDRYESLLKQIAKFKLPENPKRPEYPEAPKRPEYPKTN